MQETGGFMNFADPSNDVAFRIIFGKEKKTEILISFLNHILDFAGTNKEIQQITRNQSHPIPKLSGLDATTLDLRVLDKRGVQYIV
jgi:hypothetical protein